MKSVLLDPIDDQSALVEVTALRRTHNKPLPEGNDVLNPDSI